jgi:glycine betaine/proline transport system substrate-binding protein
LSISGRRRQSLTDRRVGEPAQRGTRLASHARTALALLPGLLLALVTGMLTAGCGDANQANVSTNERVSLGYVQWDESVAVANLTRVLLEEGLGYEEVELRRGEPEAILRDVASGDLDAFQGVWMPNHQSLFEEDEAEPLGAWLIGTTRSSLAAPDYMRVRNIEKLEAAGPEKMVGVEPGAAPIETPTRFASRHHLEQDLYPSTSAMLEEVDRLYEARRPFVFLAWSPHWMNEEYEFDYIEDPDGALGGLTRPARLHMVVRKDLGEEDPLAYALLDIILLDEHQVHDLELTIRDAESPQEGAGAWVRDHERLAQAWIEAARVRAGLPAQESSVP